MGRLTNLASQILIFIRYRFLTASSDPKSMYEFVNLLTRFHYKRKRSGMPEKNIQDLFASSPPDGGMTLLFPSPEFFSIETDELWVLCMLVRSLQPKRIFEFGTFDGFTTIHLAANAPPGCEVLTIDRQSGKYDFAPLRFFGHSITVGGRFHEHQLASRIHQLTGDSRTFDFTPYKGTCDLVFLDADHGYEGTRIDTENAMTLLRPGGTLLWHDCFAEGVAKFLKEFSRTHSVARIRSTTLALYRKS